MFELYQDNAGEWRWRLKSGNHEIMGDSGEGYTREEDCERAIERVRELVAIAPIVRVKPNAADA